MLSAKQLPQSLKRRLKDASRQLRSIYESARAWQKHVNTSYHDRICHLQSSNADKYLALLNQHAATPLTMADYQFLCALFSPDYYADQAGLKRRSNKNIFEHFLSVGLPLGLSPSPFFDAQYLETHGFKPEKGEPVIISWLRTGLSKRAVPSPWFDGDFYNDLYGDVKKSGMFAFEHYIRHGLHEGRQGVSWFKPAEHTWMMPDGSEPVYQAFLAHQVSLFKPFALRSGANILAVVSKLGVIYARHANNLKPDDIVQVWEDFSDDHYRTQAGLGSKLPRLQLVMHFLEEGVWANFSPSLDFDSEQYLYDTGLSAIDAAYWHWATDGHYRSDGRKAQAKTSSKKLTVDDSAYLKFSALRNLTPHQKDILENLFQADFYARHAHLPSSRSAAWLYGHFLSQGIKTGTRFSPLFDEEFYLEAAARHGLSVADAEPAIVHWLSKGRDARITPTRLFSERQYLSFNKDIRAEDTFAFEHFLLHGQYEHRSVVSWIDPAWYSPDTSRHRLFQFLCQHIFEGFTPIHALEGLRPHIGDLIKDVAFYERFVARAFDCYKDITADDFATLAYSVTNGSLVAGDEKEAGVVSRTVGDFLCRDLWDDINPTPLFSPAKCRKEFARLRIKPADGTPLLLQWVVEGRQAKIIPTDLFDEAYYRSCNPDLADAPIWPFDHFFVHGVRESRVANPLFDPHWYTYQAQAHYAFSRLPLLVHYLTFGEDLNYTPARAVACVVGSAKTVLTVDSYADMLNALRPLTAAYSVAAVQYVIALFVPSSVHAKDTLDTPSAVTASVAEFTDYIQGILDGSDINCALFDQSYYKAAAKLQKTTGVFKHFLKHGMDQRIQPTPLFDETYYTQLYGDVRQAEIWPYLHFVLHGTYEGREPNGKRVIAIAPGFADWRMPAFAVHWRRFWRAYSSGSINAKSRGVSLKEHVDAVLDSPVFADVIARAQRHDPEIGNPKLYKEILVAPLHDQMESMQMALQARFEKSHYDNIVCVPWIRMGGADLVACLLADCLATMDPDQSTLILRVDYPNFERPEWLPDTADIVDISDIMQAQSQSWSERLLYGALTGLTPKRIFNVNSRLTWTTIARFGKRLKLQADLFAYLFCWDMQDGVRAGYPSEFYPTAGDHLKAVLTDTNYLKLELERMYSPPAEHRRRIHPLFTPLRDESVKMATVATTQNVRPKVLWAGRLDPQKRFDLVLDIAAAMPHVDFECWGAPVLEQAAPDMSLAPANLTLNKPFKDYSELPLEQCDAWLFTAAWEGLPTILIELGARGAPIVASAVGGVPELITPQTGWPITDVDNIASYVAAIEQVITNKAMRSQKRQALFKLTHERHSRRQYIRSLQTVFGGEAK